MICADEYFLDEHFLASFDLFDAETDLSSDLSPSDVEETAGYKSKESRKRSRGMDSDSEISLPKRKTKKSCPTALPVVAPTKYANYLVSAINEHDPDRLQECLRQICIKDAKVNLNIYNVKDFQKGKKTPTNHFGDFQTANLNLNDFISLQESMNTIVPDGFMELTSSKCCFESTGSSVYISCFQMKGTIISTDSRIATGDVKGNLVRILAPNPAILKSSSLSKYSKPFVAEGSMVMYRNESGKMTGIEFYYEFA
jgi:hypothetical protein